MDPWILEFPTYEDLPYCHKTQSGREKIPTTFIVVTLLSLDVFDKAIKESGSKL